MHVKIRQKCGLNELTLMKKMKENRPSSVFTSVDFSSKCSLWKLRLSTYILENIIPTILPASPRASNPLPVSFYNKDTGWIISPLSTCMDAGKWILVKKLAQNHKNRDCKDDSPPQSSSLAVTQSSQPLAILQHVPQDTAEQRVSSECTLRHRDYSDQN